MQAVLGPVKIELLSLHERYIPLLNKSIELYREKHLINNTPLGFQLYKVIEFMDEPYVIPEIPESAHR